MMGHNSLPKRPLVMAHKGAEMVSIGLYNFDTLSKVSPHRNMFHGKVECHISMKFGERGRGKNEGCGGVT